MLRVKKNVWKCSPEGIEYENWVCYNIRNYSLMQPMYF